MLEVAPGLKDSVVRVYALTTPRRTQARIHRSRSAGFGVQCLRPSFLGFRCKLSLRFRTSCELLDSHRAISGCADMTTKLVTERATNLV